MVSPEGFAPSTGRLEADCSSTELRRFEIGARGRSCTFTGPLLRRMPLLLGYVGVENGPGGRNCTRTGSVLSGVPLLLGYTGMEAPDGFAPSTF
jgi:hypothetical protein